MGPGIGPQPFEEAVLPPMIVAGPTAWGAEWDIKDAYRCIDFNPEDADLTQSEIPLLNFAYQAAGIFGAATGGYRCQVSGKLPAIEHSVPCDVVPLSVSQDSSFVTAASPSALSCPSNADIFNPVFLTHFFWSLGRTRANDWPICFKECLPSLTFPRHCTDDFLHCTPSFSRVRLATLVIAFLHRLYKFVLKPSKCITRVPKFEFL